MTENMMQTFATAAPVTAIVQVPAGRIQILAAGQDTTTVEIAPADPAKGRDVTLAGQITTSYADGVLRVAGPARNRVFGSTGAVEVRIQLPAGSGVEATAASAQFTTDGPLGEVVFDSAQGTVTVGQVATARLTTVDGDITVGRLDGDAQLRTARGDITVAEAGGGTVEARTETGAITITAAAGVSATLDAGTTTGRISNTLANTGTPALAIRATTTVGDITARSQ